MQWCADPKGRQARAVVQSTPVTEERGALHRTRGGRRPQRRLLGAFVVSAVVGLAACGSGHPSASAAPRFVDDTAAAGVDHSYTGEFDYFVGGGVAAFDCD